MQLVDTFIFKTARLTADDRFQNTSESVQYVVKSRSLMS